MYRIVPLTVIQVVSAQLLMKPGPAKLFGQMVKMSKEGTERIYPTVRSLSYMLSCSIRTVQRWMNDLVDAGFIYRLRRRVEGSVMRCHANLYTVMTALVRRANTISWGEFGQRKFEAAAARAMRSQLKRRVTNGLQSLDGDMDVMEERFNYTPNYNKEKSKVARQSPLYQQLMAKGLGRCRGST